MLPLRPGLPARQSYDYKRNGTTTLFAALEVATGKITADACYPRHRHQEFLRFLKKAAAAHPAVDLHIVAGQLRRPQAPRRPGLAERQPADNAALHPGQLLMAQHGGDLLRHHHPPGHPPRDLPLGERPHRRDRRLHRRLQRPLPALHLDQGRRRVTRQNQTVKELTPRDTSRVARNLPSLVTSAMASH